MKFFLQAKAIPSVFTFTVVQAAMMMMKDSAFHPW
jgi:hypothetical protein